MGNIIVKLDKICKNYQQEEISVPALKDVCLEVEEGDYLAIMGPSGSGKSTLMNIIGCLDLPSSGTYQLDGIDILSQSDNDLAEVRCHKVGFVFQNFQLLNEESAIENVKLPLSFAGVPFSERSERAQAALERVGLGDRLKFRPTQLSGGQKQRVAIARALVNEPKILLADEPTGALDQKSGAQVMELFKQLNDEGVTIIMITHDAHIAKQAKKIMYIVDGELRDSMPEYDMDASPSSNDKTTEENVTNNSEEVTSHE